ncbi:MAG: M15 family metallopeptidase [Candidatus Berkiella sp.]
MVLDKAFKKVVVATLWFFVGGACWAGQFESLPDFSITPIRDRPLYEKNLSTRDNWPCKSTLKKLVLVKFQYWGFDDQIHSGSLIVHEELGPEVLAIFKELLMMRFPIQAMHPIPKSLHKTAKIYQSVTGGFHCRAVTDQPGILSQHSYGRAIDLNPMMNPYLKGCLIIPAAAKQHANRLIPEKGKIIPNSAVITVFAKHGWDWGGYWFDAKDYQHFEKRAHGEKRNPYGYITSHYRYSIAENYCG